MRGIIMIRQSYRISLRQAAALCVAAVLCPALVAWAAEVRLEVPDVQAPAGTEVTVPIKITGAKGLGALQMALVFDPAILEPIGAEAGAAVGNCLFQSNQDAKGRMGMALAGAKGIESDDGVLVNARFKVIGDAGQSCKLTAIRVRAWDYKTEDEALLVSQKDGLLTVTSSGLSPTVYLIIAGVAVVILLTIVVKIRRKKISSFFIFTLPTTTSLYFPHRPALKQRWFRAD